MGHGYQVWFCGQEDFFIQGRPDKSGSKTAQEYLVREALSRILECEGPDLERAYNAYKDVTPLVELVKDDFPLIYRQYMEGKEKS